ncbi:superfamily I DNA and RNA helicase [Roseibium hamelinense]|uniref:DNA 3'-5' helicase II n=1 Tax=Roseibium hamelinense TaxID=150831 RepID=A0A562SKR9_9HYPH|nr:ATP-binding domain-containing protein [Roseibium hamelinense]MTI43440.1 DNA helicase [Roseibium hamelinense]TWI81899.1 superfamily I DNA and RNA helicase [Roseibium hamelinense]
MTSSFFFLQTEKNEENQQLLDVLEEWASSEKKQIYVVDRPLGDEKYEYGHEGHVIILAPGRKICLVNFGEADDDFEEFVEDFIEDLGSISDKYNYKDSIGRPRKWRDQLIWEVPDGHSLDIDAYVEESFISDPSKRRVSELLISLITGSINDIERTRSDVPDNLLDKVKKKIILFDGDQTRFIYQQIDKKSVHIQGLSGTGKTELLLHKLRDIYVKNPSAKIVLTCHNRILAYSLQKRIPEFFNFMRVEQQIEWNKRLWCMHAWGSQSNPNSGTYRYICSHFDIPFFTFGDGSFDLACKRAIKAIEEKKKDTFAFDYILIDESQDFPQSFIDLCEVSAREYVVVAGDVFQSIFDAKIRPSISPDFLLSKCYRTDPRALMFAHSLGMGLFEKRKLRWLEDDEWSTCGYLVETNPDKSFYRLRREPLRRFEDISNSDFDSVAIIEEDTESDQEVADLVIKAINEICEEHPTTTPDDIGIILVDSGRTIYRLADKLEQLIPRKTGWPVNKAFETKMRTAGSIFISNRNNVKGLEFPFVICVSRRINRSYPYRNSLYMTLTRSFLKSYLILSSSQDEDMMSQIRYGLSIINEKGFIEAQPPTEEERSEIMTTITQANVKASFFDLCENIFDELEVLPIFRKELRKVVTATSGEDFDRDEVLEIARFNYTKMLKKEG